MHNEGSTVVEICNQIFAIRPLIEKACEWYPKLYMGFMDLETAYAMVDREGW